MANESTEMQNLTSSRVENQSTITHESAANMLAHEVWQLTLAPQDKGGCGDSFGAGTEMSNHRRALMESFSKEINAAISLLPQNLQTEYNTIARGKDEIGEFPPAKQEFLLQHCGKAVAGLAREHQSLAWIDHEARYNVPINKCLGVMDGGKVPVLDGGLKKPSALLPDKFGNSDGATNTREVVIFGESSNNGRGQPLRPKTALLNGGVKSRSSELPSVTLE